MDVIDIVRFRDGKMVDHCGVADRLGMFGRSAPCPALSAAPGPARPEVIDPPSRRGDDGMLTLP